MVVVDASAVVDLLIELPVNETLRERIEEAGELHAPHLLDVEVLSVLRRLVAGGELSVAAAGVARGQFRDLAIERYPHMALSERMWALRESLTTYDATYVALSEGLDLPLITSDRRLARSSGRGATIESFAR